jgi:hypothetical protein
MSGKTDYLRKLMDSIYVDQRTKDGKCKTYKQLSLALKEKRKNLKKEEEDEKESEEE